MKRLNVFFVILFVFLNVIALAAESDGGNEGTPPPVVAMQPRTVGGIYQPIGFAAPDPALDTPAHFFGQGVIQISSICAYSGLIEVKGESAYHAGPSRQFTYTLHAPFTTECIDAIATSSAVGLARALTTSTGMLALDAPFGLVTVMPRTASVRSVFAAFATSPLGSGFSLALLDYFVHSTADGSVEIVAMWRLP